MIQIFRLASFPVSHASGEEGGRRGGGIAAVGDGKSSSFSIRYDHPPIDSLHLRNYLLPSGPTCSGCRAVVVYVSLLVSCLVRFSVFLLAACLLFVLLLLLLLLLGRT